MDIWAQIIGVDMTPGISFLSDGATTVVILYNHQVNNTINNNNNNNNISHVHCFAFHSFKGLARFPALSFGCAFFSFPPFSLAAHCFPRSCFDCIPASCFLFGWISFLNRAFSWLWSLLLCYIPAPALFIFCHAFYSRYCLFSLLFVICCTSLVLSRSLSSTLSPTLQWKLGVLFHCEFSAHFLTSASANYCLNNRILGNVYMEGGRS